MPRVLVGGGRRAARPGAPPCDARIVLDPIDGEGPLVALLGGLYALDAERAFTFVATTDAPFVDERVVRALACLGAGRDAAVAVIGGKRHVLHALYGARATAVARSLVERGERRASRLAEALDTRWITEDELRAAVPRTRCARS
ncbi:MAG: NTP transferase domain-containing protein [Polyangiaceae bacterium]